MEGLEDEGYGWRIGMDPLYPSSSILYPDPKVSSTSMILLPFPSFLPLPLPERQAMVMWPPCWKVTDSPLTEQKRTDMSAKPATGVE